MSLVDRIKFLRGEYEGKGRRTKGMLMGNHSFRDAFGGALERFNAAFPVTSKKLGPRFHLPTDNAVLEVVSYEDQGQQRYRLEVSTPEDGWVIRAIYRASILRGEVRIDGTTSDLDHREMIALAPSLEEARPIGIKTFEARKRALYEPTTLAS